MYVIFVVRAADVLIAVTYKAFVSDCQLLADRLWLFFDIFTGYTANNNIVLFCSILLTFCYILRVAVCNNVYTIFCFVALYG